MIELAFMKNQLADIPDQIAQLETLHDERGFSSVQELRGKYRDAHLRRVLSGQLQTDNPDARRLPQLKHPMFKAPAKIFQIIRVVILNGFGRCPCVMSKIMPI